jgi:shikimate kinase
VTPVAVLVGPPGAGKTTVGELVADRLGVAFTDADHVVEQRAGKSVADIFVEDGEDEFRRLERAVVAELLQADGVVALGGGAVVDDGTRAALQGHTVVFLDVGLGDAVERVGFARSRPLLVLNPRAELKRMLDARRPLYEEVASLTVGTDGRSPDEVATVVVDAVGPLP